MSAAHESNPPAEHAVVSIDETGELQVTTTATDPTRATVALCGEMDLSNVGLFAGVLDNQLGLGRRFVRVDLSAITFLDCAALQVIVDAHNRCLAARGMLVLTGVPSHIARLLALTRLDKALFVADAPGSPGRPSGRQLAAVPTQ
jgi:anti-sigma B factor antagonist